MSKKQQLTLMDKPIYHYWQALYLAFYSRHLYVDVAKRWRGYGVLYLLLLIAIAAIPLSVRGYLFFNQYFNEQIIIPIEKLPPLYVQNGELIFDKPMPYLIKNSKGKAVLIIDTTGKVKSIDKTHPDLTVLITKDALFVRLPTFQSFFSNLPSESEDNIYAQSLRKEINEVFVGKEWLEASGVLKMKWIGLLLVYPLMVSFIYGFYLVAMLFFAFFAQLCSIIIFKYKMTYKDTARLFLVASTPETFLLFGLLSLNITFRYSGLCNIAILALYFSFAALTVRRESNQLVRL